MHVVLVLVLAVAAQTDSASMNYQRATATVTNCPVGDLTFSGFKTGTSFGSIGLETWTATGCERVWECKRSTAALIFGASGREAAQTSCVPISSRPRTVASSETVDRTPRTTTPAPHVAAGPSEKSVRVGKILRAIELLACNARHVNKTKDEVMGICGGYFDGQSIESPATE